MSCVSKSFKGQGFPEEPFFSVLKRTRGAQAELKGFVCSWSSWVFKCRLQL